MSRSGLVLLLAALLLPARVRGQSAAFDWFSYSGDDSIYRAVKAGPGQYLNPILAGFYPDPSIVRVGGDYYLVTSSFAYYPGVPVFHSRDLVHWTQIGSVLDRPSQLALDGAGISRGIFAPTIRYHAGTFYMITTLVDRGGTFLVTANDPAGPWSDPVWLPQANGIDPSLFFDDDGRAYVVNNGPPIGRPLYQGHRAIWIQQYDIAARKMVGPRKLIVNGGVDLSKKPIWIEAPHLFKLNGRYYLICAEGGTGDQHSEVVFRSDSVRGPYVPYAHNPILTQRQLDPRRPFPITSTGHADFVQTQNGQWWAVFLGTRPYGDDLYNTGRETFLLPVHWQDGWPIILGDDARVPYVHARPELAAQPPAPVPTSGNFTVRDDFSEHTLPPYWSLMRTPRGVPWYDLSSRPGWLTLRARPETLSGRGQPSFVGRRQQHAIASASTAMTFAPAHPGDFAGLAAFQNETHYYALGVGLVDGKPAIRLERRAGGAPDAPAELVASAPLSTPPGGVASASLSAPSNSAASAPRSTPPNPVTAAPRSTPPASPVYLRIDARGPVYDFYYAERPGAWHLLKGGEDGTMLSTKVAGGFVGTFFGLFAVAGGE